MDLRYCILPKIQIYRGAIKYDIILHCTPPPLFLQTPPAPTLQGCNEVYGIKDQGLTKWGGGGEGGRKDRSPGNWDHEPCDRDQQCLK